MAGRSAKCACGAKIVVPQAAPPMPAPVAAVPELAQKLAKCPSCSKSLEPGAVLCVACGYNVKTGQKLSLVVEDAGDEDEDDDVESIPAKSSA
jgi:hypothetical protein